ncbi:hypothetical protein NW768_011804 [Fusarium equiseti]|uniref:Peptidase S8/S53 domain-containing protein n=1 Tax=Fusarium equiseti TaxID=61235 RepID=A0ABQ8QWF8_FUSEQ|nr:hypothetical protein NW768_011804 [Fusarium equiseti]
MNGHLQLGCEQQENYDNPGIDDNLQYEPNGDFPEEPYGDDDDEDEEDEDEDEEDDEEEGGLHHRADAVRHAIESIIPRLEQQALALSPLKLYAIPTGGLSKEEEQDLIRKRDAQRLRFFEDFKRDIRPQDEKIKSRLQLEDYNILYHLASSRSANASHDWLFQYAACHFPALLREFDSDNGPGGPIMKAIHTKKDHFITAVLDSDVDREQLAQAIALTDHSKRNCIHVALKSTLPTDVIIKLIEAASEETLCKQDRDELTPLHYAVDYERCTKDRLPVVEALIKRSDKAFDIKSEKPGLRSVFLYHINSRKNYKEPKKRSNPASRNPTRPRDNRSQPSKAPNGRPPEAPRNGIPDKEKAKKDPKEATLEEERRRLEQSRENGHPQKLSLLQDPAKARVAGESKYDPTHEMKGIRRSNTGLKDEEARNGYQISSSKGKDSAGPSSKRSVPTKRKKDTREETANIIAKELKLHYLRSIFRRNTANMEYNRMNYPVSVLRTSRTAIEFLYGDNENDQQLYFEFPAMPKKEPENIDIHDFKESYRNFKFDEVLQYVKFRPLKIANRPLDPRAGREDVSLFFRWLSEEKLVKNIVKVIVDDKSNTPHSDLAIEKSLRLFEIDILEWQKIDLDPETIRFSCRDTNLRELRLLWSGSNAVLRAWSEPEGLVEIKTLERIVIYEDEKHLEPKQQISRNLEEFRKRILKNRKKEYTPISCSWHRAEPQARSRTKADHNKEPGKTSQNYRWLDIMDDFVSGMDNLEFPDRFADKYQKDESLPLPLRQDVTVALIDDGVDLMHKGISGNIGTGRSFGNAFEDQDLSGAPQSFHASATGHGTCMAQMITRMCPKVKIFVCKLDFIRQHAGKPSFTAKSAAEAVEHAILRRFDIISISWTIYRDKNNKDDLERLRKALSRADDLGILVFCSAPDIGSERSQTLQDYYPYGCETLSPCVFRIGASNAEGISHKNDKINVDYMLPGYNVHLREDDQLNEVDGLPKTGSSVATALAAGLAALVIHCVRISAIYSFYAKNPIDSDYINLDSFKEVKRLKGMKAAFNAIDSKNAYIDKDDKNLRVGTFFKGHGEVLKPDGQNGDEIKWAQIMKISNDLTPSFK